MNDERNMLKVIFVDDDEDILKALRGRLRKFRSKWDMRFANSGLEALQMLGEAEADVIISDMRMPGMDGAELLTAVRNCYPKTARIILSGYSENDLLMKAIPVSHRLLAKPCDPSVLEDAISRSQGIIERLADPKMKTAIGKIGELPTVPPIYARLQAVIDQVNCTAEKIASVIAEDPGLTAKVLQIANSSLLGVKQEVRSVRDAVAVLGVTEVQALAVSGYLGMRVSEDSEDNINWVSQINKHSQQVAQIAGRISPSHMKSDAYTAGILHDIGKVVLLSTSVELFYEIAVQFEAGGRSWINIEEEVLGQSHAEVGACLLDMWGLPKEIVEAVRIHHNSPDQLHSSLQLGRCIAVANHITKAIASGDGEDEIMNSIPAEFSGQITSSNIKEWIASLDQVGQG